MAPVEDILHVFKAPFEGLDFQTAKALRSRRCFDTRKVLAKSSVGKTGTACRSTNTSIRWKCLGRVARTSSMSSTSESMPVPKSTAAQPNNVYQSAAQLTIPTQTYVPIEQVNWRSFLEVVYRSQASPPGQRSRSEERRKISWRTLRKILHGLSGSTAQASSFLAWVHMVTTVY
jgi:hypothetical protein